MELYFALKPVIVLLWYVRDIPKNFWKSWKEVPASGEFSNIMHNPLPQTVAFSQKVQARFIKLEATTPDATVAKVNMNEIGVMVIP